MGFFEKRSFRNFLIFLQNYDKTKPSTYLNGKSLDQVTTKQMFEYYSLTPNTQAFTGHAMALHRDDDYLEEPATATAEAIQLYAFSLERYGKSPYIYPLYGLGSLPEGFSRLCAIHGGTFMLNKGIDEILFDESGKAWGVKAENEVAKANIIVGDPSYFSRDKTRVTGRVVRSICVLDHPVPGTDNAESVQIIIPANQVRRRNDIYVCMVSFAHNVASSGKYIAIVSTTVETSNPIQELAPGFNLLGSIMERSVISCSISRRNDDFSNNHPFIFFLCHRFDSVTDLYEPVTNGRDDNCYVSKSYDATSHFETAANDVLSLFERITGTSLDMNISADMDEEDA